MKTSEQILKEIQSAMELNKNIRAKCNTALSDAISLIQHNEKEMHDRLDEEYKRGMDDAWEIAREICKMNREEYNMIFHNATIDLIIIAFDPAQIKEKISAYQQEKESNKIHVGDVVQHIAYEIKATILDCDEDTSMDNDELYWIVFTENGCVESWCKNEFTKTGESVDICNALIK